MAAGRFGYRLYYDRARTLYRERPEVSASVEVVLTVFAVAFMVMFALRPTLRTIAELRKNIADQETVDQKLTSKITALSLAQRNLQEQAARLSLYEAAVPDNHDVAGLARRLEAMAQESEVEVESFRFEALPLVGNKLELVDKQQPVLSGETTTLPVSMEIEGSLAAVRRFVVSLEGLDRVILVRSVDLEKRQKTAQAGGTIVATIRAEVYYKN